MKRAWIASLLGAACVGTLSVLGHHDIATPIPFVSLLPGIFVAAILPGSHFDPEGGDAMNHQPLSILVMYAVNIAIYGGLAYLLLRLGRILRRPSDETPAPQ